MFVHLLFFWSIEFLSDETRTHFFNLLHGFEQQLRNKSLDSSDYLYSVVTYCDCVLAVLGQISGQEFLSDEKISFLNISLNSELADKSFTGLSEVGTGLSKRLFFCYALKMNMIRDEMSPEESLDGVETCRNALDLSLKLLGKQHEKTAFCYIKLGQAETAAENYVTALNAFNQAIEILETADDEGSKDKYIFEGNIMKGKVYSYMNKYELAIESFEEALKRRRLIYGVTKETVKVLFWLGDAQVNCNDPISARGTLQRAVEIIVKLHSDKRCSSILVSACYCLLAQVHTHLGNSFESVNVLRIALEMGEDCIDERSIAELFVLSLLFGWEQEENLTNTDVYDFAPRVITEKYKPLCAGIHLKLAANQFKCGKYKDGLMSLQKAFDINLNETIMLDDTVRESTVVCYMEVGKTLVMTGKIELAKNTIDRATKIAESLPECKRHVYVLCCYNLKGKILNKKQEHVSAIECLNHALLQLLKLSPDAVNKFAELDCRCNIGVAYFFEESYRDALTSLYDALCVVKDLFPEGSEDEGNLYFCVAAIANKMQNKSLALNNFRLAYKMYSKILGNNHPTTNESYIAYARALISC